MRTWAPHQVRRYPISSLLMVARCKQPPVFTLNPNRGITLEDGGGTIDVTGANTLSYAGVAI